MKRDAQRPPGRRTGGGGVLAVVLCAAISTFARPDAARADGAASPVSPGAGDGAVIVEWGPAAPPLRSAAAGAAYARELSARAGAVASRPLFAGHAAPGDPLARFWIVQGAAGVSAGTLAGRLRSDPAVAGAEPDRIVPLASCLPSDPYFAHAAADSAQWPLDGNPIGPDLDAVEAWNVTPGDSSLVIGVIDSGVNWHHPDFGATGTPGGTIYTNWAEATGAPGVDDDHNGFIDDVHGWDFVDVSTIPGETTRIDPREDGLTPDNDPSDYDGHGTFVAGLIGAAADNRLGMAGAAPGCRVMPLRAGWREDYVDPNSGDHIVGGVVSMAFCAQAIVYAADTGVRVLNCSWLSDSIPALAAALDYAIQVRRVVVVDAAGNGGLTETQKFNYLSRRGDCIEVAAVNRDGTANAVTAIGDWIDLSAPGSELLSLTTSPAHPYRINRAGATSFSAPFVSAAAGLVLSADSTLSPAEVRSRLMSTATPLDAQNPVFIGKLGAGLVDEAGALRAAVVNPRTPWPAPPAAPPLAFRNGLLVSVDSGGRMVRVVPGAARPDSAPWSADSPVAGTAAAVSASGGLEFLAVACVSGHVALLDSLGRAMPGWPRPIGGLLFDGPVVADLDGDGDADVVVAGTDSTLYAWDRAGRLKAGFPVRLSQAALVAPAIGDLDRDGTPDIVVVTQDGRLQVVGRPGSDRTGFVAGPFAGAGRRSPLLADVDGDGRLEIILAGGGRVRVLSADGTPLLAPPGGATPLEWAFDGELAAADLNGNDRAQVIGVDAAGGVWLFDAAGSAPRPGFPVTLPAAPVGGPLAVMVDGTPRPSILVATREGCLHALDRTGRELRGWPKRHAGDLVAAPAADPVFSPSGGGVWVAAGGEAQRFALPANAAPKPAPWAMAGGDAGRTRTLPPTAAPPLPVSGSPPLALLFWPNPFRDAAQIRLTLPEPGPATLRLYDVQGRLIARLLDGPLPQGPTLLRWNGRDDRGASVPSGLYFYRLIAGGRRITGRLVRG